eukprot:TRINITY_DN13289_c0_g1_i1.p1 TRINITY_DN13289_c0_g1~~TRINITY_DN13289_c0_g1_i1.p1  ORF type:complete len:285 (+),score=36.64 TRINITY_DN13289_c0_g1_i1:87-941(+)
MKKAHPSVEFTISGLAGIGAITCMNPVDVVKTRLQLQGEGGARKQYSGVLGTFRQVLRTEGVRGLYRGLSAAWLLQFSNVGTRFGGYAVIKKALGIEANSGQNCAMLLVSGGLSGALAGVVSNPFFLLKTRMQALGSSQTLRQTVSQLLREEGILGFWRGVPAFILRVAAASSVQLAFYDMTKMRFKSMLPDGFFLHFFSSWVTGIAVVFAMQPFDFAATRVMSHSSSDYTVIRCLRLTLQQEGVLAIYQGTLANYLRFGPYCILVFVFAEQMKAAVNRLGYDM